MTINAIPPREIINSKSRRLRVTYAACVKTFRDFYHHFTRGFIIRINLYEFSSNWASVISERLSCEIIISFAKLSK